MIASNTHFVRRPTFTAYTIAEVDAIFNARPSLNTKKRRNRCLKHLETDYSQFDGAKRLGYTVVRPYVIIHAICGDLDSTTELMVECVQGHLSHEEAQGLDYVPTHEEIEAHKRSIRRANEAAGLIRQTEYLGFDIGRVYPTTV